MASLKPDIYKKDLFSIDYGKLKAEGIKCIIFDLDNTIMKKKEKSISKETEALLKKLKKSFIITICSNNFSKRAKILKEKIVIDCFSLSMKPSVLALAKIRKRYNLKKEEMCIIGDQLLTDIMAGKRYKISTILVDKLGEDIKISKLGRIVEEIIITKYQDKKIFERGKYYG